MRSEWKIRKISDIAEVNPRESIRKGSIAKKIPMDVLQPFTRDVPSYQMEEYKGGTKFRNMDTIMARITPCLENGKIAQVRCLNNKEVGFGSTEYIVFRAKGGTDPDYLYYLIRSPLVRDPAIKSMVGSSGRQRVQTNVVSNLQIAVPDYKEQVKIGELLRELDDKIEINNQINKNLEAQAQAYFIDRFIANADPTWSQGTLSDLGTVVGGGTPSKKHPEYYSEHGISWITPKDLSVDKSKFISHGENDISDIGFSNSSATKMPKGTVLFSSRAPIGYIAIALNVVTTNQGFKSVIPNTNVGTAYIYFFLKQALPIIEGIASGSTFKEISGSGMKSVPAIIPDNETLHFFSEFCKPLFEQQAMLEAESRKLSGIRNALLPKLMSGEIDVAHIDI